MIFNTHSDLAGQHAFLSASKYHWINYSDDKLDATYLAALAAARGTRLHDFAHKAIELGIKLDDVPQTLNQYVNDAIGFRMTPEQILYYSDNCFGTADAISFSRMKLRISDLKTGSTATSEHQLEVYAALFCLEYRMKPMELDIELRIYQNNEVRLYIADPDVITHIMDRIITFDRRINAIRRESLS